MQHQNFEHDVPAHLRPELEEIREELRRTATLGYEAVTLAEQCAAQQSYFEAICRRLEFSDRYRQEETGQSNQAA